MAKFNYRIVIYDGTGKTLYTYVYDEQKTCMDCYKKLIKERHAKKWIIEVVEVLKCSKGSEV